MSDQRVSIDGEREVDGSRVHTREASACRVFYLKIQQGTDHKLYAIFVASNINVT